MSVTDFELGTEIEHNASSLTQGVPSGDAVENPFYSLKWTN